MLGVVKLESEVGKEVEGVIRQIEITVELTAVGEVEAVDELQVRAGGRAPLAGVERPEPSDHPLVDGALRNLPRGVP